MNLVHRQAQNFLFQTQMGNPPDGGASTYQGGYIPQASTNNSVPSYNGPIHPTVTPSSSYPFYAQPMYAPPNIPAYPNPAGPFADSAGSVTPFVRWIKDYPLLDELKMPSYIGSYDGKGDPGNFLHLFEGAIHMQKWLMPVACHMFTYALKAYVRILWNSQKTGFVLGLRTRSLVEHLSTDLPSTYKGLMEKTYTWVEERETPQNSDSRGCKLGAAFAPSERNKERKDEVIRHHTGESKKDKGTTPTEAPILMVNIAPVIIEAKIFGRKVGRVYMDSGSSYEIIYEHYFEKRNPTIKAAKVDLKTPLVGKNSDAKDGNPNEGAKRARKILATSKESILSYANTEEQIIVNDKYLDQTVTIEKQLPNHFKKELQSLLKSNTDIFAWTYDDMTGISRTIMVEGKPFNMEHKLNECSHIKLIKQNKRGLGPDRNMAACKETEELTKARILQKVKHQTWVANPIMVKTSDRGWRMCVDFTDINKACPKDCYPLPEIDWKIKSLSGFHLKCFLDAYKGATYQRNAHSVLKKALILGHLVTKHGIKSNPSKVKAVTDLDQPRTLKDIQSLNGKLAALSWFLSKGAEQSVAFFKVLKECKDKKSIQWTTEADKALEKMKKLVQSLPTLTALRVGETLTMHLAASKESISVVLAAKRNKGWTLIYFAHTITILTKTPIKQILIGPEKTRSVAKWVIELGEHDIVFLRREEKEMPPDFLIEIPSEDNETKEKLKEVLDSSSKWRLYTNRASNSDRSGAGLMLIDPEGKEYTYALRFKFETTNNEAEYKALLAGLQIAQEMQIAKVAIFLDS
ncbi:reverse transcriptase domain-containing protein [Tanacetum coccineum]